MDQLNYYWLEEYQLGKDFIIDIQKTVENKITYYDFFFRNWEKELLWYIKLGVRKWSWLDHHPDNVSATILDTASSSSFSKHMDTPW